MSNALTVEPLTASRWADVETLFGPERGANSGCWCMWLRIGGAAYEAMERQERQQAFRSIVEAGPPPGLLAYDSDKAVGWCAVGPRPSVTRFHGAKASRSIEDYDGPPSALVYAVTCFFVSASHRRRGVSTRLAAAAVDFARARGAAALDACPTDQRRPLVRGEGFVGLVSVFASLGFREIARRLPHRPLMRLDFHDGAGAIFMP